MNRTTEQLRRDAIAIWRAGVAAVESDRLVRENVRVDDRWLEIGPERLELSSIRHIVVVGAGKAGAGMAAGLESALGATVLADKQVTGHVNVPENCVRALARIHLHAARPGGINEPTEAGVQGAREIMRLAGSLAPEDVCIALVSGGGSALLPLPVAGITLADKLAVTRFLSAAGAPIEELNIVRQQLSQIKGGGLARACGAGRILALIISDILGDPLPLIASGPTVASNTTPDEALEVLNRYGARAAGISDRVFDVLAAGCRSHDPPRARVLNFVIGNNATAVNASTAEAIRRGYVTEGKTARASEDAAEDVGRRLADEALRMRGHSVEGCLVSGGEPTVKLVDAARRGLGGRNQQLVLAAVERLESTDSEGILVLSGGTDGEDGPTDAAGAFADGKIIDEARRLGLEPRDYLQRNDAYHWFEPVGALMKTGPTDTNVCDLRVVLVERSENG